MYHKKKIKKGTAGMQLAMIQICLSWKLFCAYITLDKVVILLITINFVYLFIWRLAPSILLERINVSCNETHPLYYMSTLYVILNCPFWLPSSSLISSLLSRFSLSLTSPTSFTDIRIIEKKNTQICLITQVK